MSEPIPENLVRIEYAIRPFRAVYETYFADNGQPESHFRTAFAQCFPRGTIRKIERGVKPIEDLGKGGCV